MLTIGLIILDVHHINCWIFGRLTLGFEPKVSGLSVGQGAYLDQVIGRKRDSCFCL